MTVLNKIGIGSDHRKIRATIKINITEERLEVIHKKKPVSWNSPEDTNKYEELKLKTTKLSNKKKEIL